MDAEARHVTDEAGYGEPGFAQRPPDALAELLPPLAGVSRPRLVVDLDRGRSRSGSAARGRRDRARPGALVDQLPGGARPGLAAAAPRGTTTFRRAASRPIS